MAPETTPPGGASRYLQIALGLLSYTQLAPLLAERVLRVERDLASGAFAAQADFPISFLTYINASPATTVPTGPDAGATLTCVWVSIIPRRPTACPCLFAGHQETAGHDQDWITRPPIHQPRQQLPTAVVHVRD
jgi:hypothetical protein